MQYLIPGSYVLQFKYLNRVDILESIIKALSLILSFFQSTSGISPVTKPYSANKSCKLSVKVLQLKFDT